MSSSSSASASDCVLLHGQGFRDNLFHSDTTTATATTSLGSTIEVSLSCPWRPLLPTMLFVSIDGSELLPRILRVVEDLILFRLPLYPPEDQDPSSPNEHDDYFIYRLGGSRNGASSSSLELLPRPPTFFRDEDVGLLILRRRGDGDDGDDDDRHYTVAALHATRTRGVYELVRFDSASKAWSTDEVPLVEPQDRFPRRIPWNSSRILLHLTSLVIPMIPIGGGGSGSGTMGMGWVDLWRGVLVCDDVLSLDEPGPKLRGVPVPLPTELLNSGYGQGAELFCPRSVRGITFVSNNNNKPGVEPYYLRFVELEPTLIPPKCGGTDDNDDEEGEGDCWGMRDWKITTWSNSKMTTSWSDWKVDCTIQASETNISSKLRWKMHQSGLLLSSSSAAVPERDFQNLLVSCPAPAMDDDDHVVYLQAKAKLTDSKVFVLALDTKDNVLLNVVEFATESISGGDGVVYFPSNISRYINLEDRVQFPEDDDSWEVSKYEGTETRQLPRCEIRYPFKLRTVNDAGIAS